MPIGFKQTGKYLGLFGSPAKLDPEVGQKVGGAVGGSLDRPLLVGVHHVVPGQLGLGLGEISLTKCEVR